MHSSAAATVLAQAGSSSGSGFEFLVPMVAIVVVFLWLSHRSQKKREQERQQMLNSIRPKDDVVTIGGIHGRVVSVKDDAFVLRVDEKNDVRLTVSKSAIARKVTPGEKDEEGSS